MENLILTAIESRPVGWRSPPILLPVSSTDVDHVMPVRQNQPSSKTTQAFLEVINLLWMINHGADPFLYGITPLPLCLAYDIRDQAVRAKTRAKRRRLTDLPLELTQLTR